MIASFFPLIIIIGMFYFLIIRPQSKQKKILNEFLSSLKKGDQVLLFSGIIGKVESIDLDKGLIVISSQGTQLLIKKEAISGGYSEN